MKLLTVLLSLLPAAVLALPLGDAASSSTSMTPRSVESETDNLLFDVSLPTFISHRNADDPADLDWSSDSCSDSPDNPLGFPFDPACKRHDFGYRNYKAQGRFTDANKAKIDSNFKTECVSLT